jgi:hypothetical protein
MLQGAAVDQLILSVCNSPSSNDSHPSDFETVHAALNALKSRRAAGFFGDSVINVCEGIHKHYKTIVIGPDHTSPFGYTDIRGSHSDRAVGTTLDSGILLHNWVTNKTTGLWQAPLPILPLGAPVYSRQLWVNGVRAVRGHANPAACSGGVVNPKADCSHNIRGGNITSFGYSGVLDNFTLAAPFPSMQKWLPGAEMVYGRGASGASWTEPRCAVKSVVAGQKAGTVDIIMSQPCWGRARGKGTQSVTYPSDIENVLLLVDEPGEWYGDFADFSSQETHTADLRETVERTSSGTIYYKPKAGESISSIKAYLGSGLALVSTICFRELTPYRVEFTNFIGTELVCLMVAVSVDDVVMNGRWHVERRKLHD